jgi:serine protease
MKWLWCSIMWVVLWTESIAQIQQRINFHTLTTNDYVEGSVLVKVKPGFQSSFEQHIARARTRDAGYTVQPFAKGSTDRKQSHARQKTSGIDISLYYEIRYPKDKSIASIAAELYALGSVELVEPVYRETMQLTVNDPLLTNQYYLEKIKVFEAWDISEGDEDIIIAIVDSGVDIDHPDLVDKLFVNIHDPINGIDDDGNGFIDDFRGWDFSGDTQSLIGTDGFVGDNDVAIYKSGSGFVHGTMVGGVAAASANNGIGIAGVAKNAKLLFTKHYADDQATDSRNYSSNLYHGVLYAAELGAHIINCSWGASFRSQIYQDIITYVTLDKGCLVVAAAGNSNESSPIYPAAYDYVLSVASSDQQDKRSTFSNYGSTIDIIAPGSDILTTSYNDQYVATSGTSLASPIVAGAAALVWAKYPSYSGMQIGELLRITADESVYASNVAYKNKLGKGRLDVLKALSPSTSPSVRIVKHTLTNQHGSFLEVGEKAYLFLDFKNYLHDTNQLSVEISTTHAGVTIERKHVNMGVIPQLTVARNETPFEITFASTIQPNAQIDFLVTYRDGDYQDYETFSIVPFQTYIDINYNKVSLSVSSTGKLGFENASQSSGGRGFIFDDTSMLFEMGLIMGTSPTNLWNSIRSTSTSYDDDFVMIKSIKENIPGVYADAEAFGEFSNDKDPNNQSIGVEYKTYAWKDSPNDHFIVLEYTIENRSNATMNNFYVGLFSDWDIANEGAMDEAGWLMDVKTGYVKPKSNTSTLPIGAIQLLSEKPNFYAIDNDNTVAGSAIGLYDGFTDAEKFLSISNSVIKTQAGTSQNGGDVSHVVSSGPYTIQSGEKITVAFAVHGVKTLLDLERSAKHADTIYNLILKDPRPVIDTVTVCYEGTAVVRPSGGTLYHWYDQPRNGQLLHVGEEMIFEALKRDSVVYVAIVFDGFESLRTPVYVRVASSPNLKHTGGNVLCTVEPIVLTASFGDSFLWSNGATTKSITVTEPDEYSVKISSTVNGVFCERESESVVVTALERPVASMLVTPNITRGSYSFVGESESAIEWFWEFGDGSSSTEQSPTHTYLQPDQYLVTLKVTNAIGCEDKVSTVVSTIVAVELENQHHNVEVFPVPTNAILFISGNNTPEQRIQYTLYNTLGLSVMQGSIESDHDSFKHELNVEHLLDGVYFLQFQWGDLRQTKRIVIKK